MTTPDGLFPEEGLRVAAPPEVVDDRTAGQRLRDRQAARIAVGLHPLSFGGAVIRLHPDAPRDAHKDDDRVFPRCGGCMHRQKVGGHARDFWKCLLGYVRRPLTDAEIVANKGTWRAGATHHVEMGPRYSMSEASDCKAYWPACTDWQPKDGDEA